MKSLPPQSGFTLVEILTVLVIIGTLSAVLFASFSDARMNARNKALTTDLKEMQLALELYKSQFGQYPDAGLGTCGVTAGNVRRSNSASSACLVGGGTDIITGLTPDFIDKLPSHTKSGNASCAIIYSVDATNFSWYKLEARNCFAGATTAAEGVQANDDFARCPSSCATCAGSTMNASYIASSAFYNSYAVYSSGGQCQ